MKKLFGLFMIIALMAFFAPQNTTAQAHVDLDYTAQIDLQDYGYLVCTGSRVITPSGNWLIKLEAQINPSHPIVPKKGVTKKLARIWYGPRMFFDFTALIYPDGTVKAIFHYNGSGYVTPNSGNK